jgi:hypothetical protein
MGMVKIENIELNVNTSMEWFGAEKREAENNELLINTTPYGLREKNVLLNDGTIILSPRSNLNSDKFKLKIPDEQVELQIKINE